MGGHQSKQSVHTTASVVTNAAMSVTQNCMTYLSGDQQIGVYGSGNVVQGNTQTMQLSVNTKCLSEMGQTGDFEAKLNSTVAGALKDQTQALTAWMEPGGSNQSTDITQAVTTNITFADVQDCMTTLSGRQLLVVSGNSNVVTDNLQAQTVAAVTNCMMKGQQTSRAVNDITNTVNQQAEYVSKSPFAFIGDAIAAAVQSAFAVLAGIVIFIVVVVLAVKLGRRKPAAAAYAAPPGAYAAGPQAV